MAKAQTKKEAATHIDGEDAKKRALETTLLQIEKDHGKGAVMRLGESPELSVTALST